MADVPGGVAVSDPIDLRLGRWQYVLADVRECDAVITDPPYSARTDAGYMSHGSHEVAASTDIGYCPITLADAHAIAASWAPRTKRWAVIFGDHISREWHATAWEAQGWYVFAPVIWVKRGAPPRFCSDGPASQVDHIMIARPRGTMDDEDKGSRPGWYLVNTPRHGHGYLGVTGSKDPRGMQAIVRDYTRPGDLVVDPFAGSGTTAIACAAEGRRCITSEEKPEHYEIARARILRGVQPSML
jgi:site-specific DNA-methyltransferase (adenine-specific)